MVKWLLVALTVRAATIMAFGATLEATTFVPKPRAQVWGVVAKMSEWKRWQPVFDVAIDGAPAVDKQITFTCNWSSGAVDVANEKIVRVENRRRLCWDWQDGPDWLLATDRCIVLSDEAKGTVVHNYEVFSGPLAPFVYWFRGGVIADGFETFNSRLRCKLAPRECK